MRFSAPLDARKVIKRIPRKFLGIPLGTKIVADWEVISPFRFYFDDDRPDVFVLVEAGWETDLASVPGFFGFVLQKDGSYTQAAVTHDWCYKNRGNVVYIEHNGQIQKIAPLTRREQDSVFIRGMDVLGTNLPTRFIMWRAVRRFGWISYPKEGTVGA